MSFVTKVWILRWNCRVLPEKMTTMRTEEIYEKVCGLLADSKVLLDGSVGFDDICAAAGADRSEIDNLLYERFGMSGEEILHSFRQGKVMP